MKKRILLTGFAIFFLLLSCSAYAATPQISARYKHTIAIKSDGTLWAWGYNLYGQLGDGTTSQRNSPVQIGTDNNRVSISAGGYHTIAIKSDGTLWAWGSNDSGQLGDGTYNNKTTPTQITTVAANWVSISTGGLHTLAIKSDGTLWAWGYNSGGQLGDGTATQRNSPVQIGTGNNWTSIAAGYYHTIAIKSDGTLWAWGYNGYGQLGDGTMVNKSSPAQIGTDNNWASIEAGGYHTLAIKSDGTLWAWGDNGYGQLGDGTNTDRFSPVQVFELISSYTLTANKSGAGSGQITSSPSGIDCGADCTELYNSGTSVTLIAAPDANSTFAGWGGDADCSDGVVTMDADKTCTAIFDLKTYTLGVTKTGTGGGTVTSSPAGINCGADCEEPYNYNTVVTLTAAAATGSSFAGYSGDCGGIMDADKTCTATFNLVQYTLTVSKAG